MKRLLIFTICIALVLTLMLTLGSCTLINDIKVRVEGIIADIKGDTDDTDDTDGGNTEGEDEENKGDNEDNTDDGEDNPGDGDDNTDGGNDGGNDGEEQETLVRSLGQKDVLEKGMATYPSILTWEIPCYPTL